MRRDGLGGFFLLAFLLPWAVWGTSIAEHRGWMTWHIPSALGFWVGLPIATFGAAAVTGGWAAVRALLGGMIRWRVSPRWYAVALLTMPILAVIAMLIGWLTGSVAAPERTTVAALVGGFAFNVWMWLWTEEPAWRGFALPRLEDRMAPLPAAVVLGVVWGLWHIPLWFVPGSFQASLPFAGFFVATIATSVIIAWVFHRGRDSILIAAIFHAATDVTIAVSGVMTSGQGLFWVFVALQAAAASAVAIGAWKNGRSVPVYDRLSSVG